MVSTLTGAVSEGEAGGSDASGEELPPGWDEQDESRSSNTSAIKDQRLNIIADDYTIQELESIRKLKVIYHYDTKSEWLSEKTLCFCVLEAV